LVETVAPSGDIARSYGWPDTPKPPKEARAINLATASRYEGQYAWEQNMTAHVMREGSRLFLKVAHDATREMDPFPPAELFAETDTRFFTVAPKMSIRFDVDQSGTVLALVHPDPEGHETQARRRP
jgi:hypothetical protein